jgi:phenylalanyl-tRNA synthetase beta chain
MRVPISWLRVYAPVPEPVDTQDVARRLTAAGLEVESVEPVGHDVRGVVVGQVLTIEELTEFKKPIRYCRVAVSEAEAEAAGAPQDAAGVICGATNFAAGDKIALAQPGAVLPGGFEIGARKTYGHVSEGMICSARELAIGDDHTGILILEPDAPLGVDFVEYAALRDEVLDIAVTPDRGYAVSVRGVARELASVYGVPYTDPALTDLPGEDLLSGDLAVTQSEAWPASIEDPTACDSLVLREVREFSPQARTPLWMRVRLARCGVRSIFLAVDVTNYLMLELGQPMHAFDRSKLHGPIVVRRARPGEKLEALDHVTRSLHTDDILITDESGPISMAGTMGGLSTEIDEASTDLVIEGAHFSAVGIAKMARRHKLHSEASYRFERDTDRELPLRATARAASLLSSLGGGRVVPGCTQASVPAEPVRITMAADYPDRVAGVVYGRDTVVRRLTEVGCEVCARGAILEVTPPSWRGDLTDPADLAEEVIRLEGYVNIPVRAPRALAGHGLTTRQRMTRAIGRTFGDAGFVEVHCDPFAPASDADDLGLPPEDPRRPAVRVANPLNEDEPDLRTTLLPGLFRTMARNGGRGFGDVALFETGLVFRPRPGAPGVAPILPTDRGPTVAEQASLEAALPDQPLQIGAVLAGDREMPGWWGPGRPASWPDAIEAARAVGRVCHLAMEVLPAQQPPWHPGRCAALYVRAVTADGARHEWLAGHAGELHPRVIAAYGLPPRSCALELDFPVLAAAAEAAGPVRGPSLSAYPPATQDVALVVGEQVPAAAVADALASGAGSLLEELRLFDVYTGVQVGSGFKSLAYTLRFRAPDRTLTAAEASEARDAAVAEAARRTGAVLRA